MAPVLSLSAVGVCLFTTVSAINANLVGTWTTKSAAVVTGPGFYNPVTDSFIEPQLTGISYSFTADGHYEEAYYRAISNPTNPSCPESILQFQHGTFVENSTGSLIMTPFGVDGRQQLSNPCAYKTSTYQRYNQAEVMRSYQLVLPDPYHGVARLNLFQFDGSPVNPMYLAYRPPQMLPTVTMNPTSAASATAGAKVKREADELEVPLNKHAKHIKRETEAPGINAAWVWWTGLGLTVMGGAAYLI